MRHRPLLRRVSTWLCCYDSGRAVPVSCQNAHDVVCMGNSSLRTGVQRRAVEAEGGGVRVPRVRCVLGLTWRCHEIQLCGVFVQCASNRWVEGCKVVPRFTEDPGGPDGPLSGEFGLRPKPYHERRHGCWRDCDTWPRRWCCEDRLQR